MRPHRPSASTIIIAILAVVQGLFGLLRTAQWVDMGDDLPEGWVLLRPIVRVLMMMRGTLVALIAVLYGVFAWGLLARRGWAWGLGLVVAIVQLVLAGLTLAEGGGVVQDLLWVVVPVIVLAYLLGPGRRAAGGMT